MIKINSILYLNGDLPMVHLGFSFNNELKLKF